MTKLSLEQAEDLACRGLIGAGATRLNAALVAAALVEAEADGLSSHGLGRLPIYAEQVIVGKIDGKAIPRATRTANAALSVDAANGFAFPAIAQALAEGPALARENGIAVAAVHNSHHAGVLGQPVEAAARTGLLAIAFTNTPAGIAPWGGNRAIFGTNPIAFAAPRAGLPPLVIDLSVSKVARGRILVAKKKGEAIPEGWALDADGQPTTDPAAALAGTMLPFGDAKGAALALMVEVLAAALTGSQFGFEASSVLDAKGPPPRLGQLFLFIDPAKLAGPSFAPRLEVLIAAILDQPDVRLPGQRRLANRARAAEQGIEISPDLLGEMQRLADRLPPIGDSMK